MAKVLLYHPRPFFRSRRDPGTAGRLPHHLLDGAIHDRRPLDSEQGALAVPALEGRARQMQQLPNLHPQLPHEPGRQSDGAAGRHGELKITTDLEIHDRAFIRERRLIRAVQFLVSKGNWVSRAAVNRRCWAKTGGAGRKQAVLDQEAIQRLHAARTEQPWTTHRVFLHPRCSCYLPRAASSYPGGCKVASQAANISASAWR
jgi:hypothetical protein